MSRRQTAGDTDAGHSRACQEHVEEEEVTKEPGGGVPSWLSWLPFWQARLGSIWPCLCQGEDNKVEEEHEVRMVRLEAAFVHSGCGVQA